MNKKSIALGLGLCAFVTLSHGALAQQGPARSITEVAGDLYRAQNGGHFTVFLVTPEGIILSDPINEEFASWLKSELEARFDVPVRYVLYSHHHWDHASGGAVFADTAEFVGHRTLPSELDLPSGDTPLPAAAGGLDADGDGRIEPSEARGELEENFRLFDADADGRLNGAEIVRGPLNDVYPAQTLFSDRHTVSLGGKSVEMLHVGPTHAADMTVLRFPEERAVFLVDFISLKRLPFRNFPGYDIDDLIAKIRAVEAMDFDIAVPAHGSVGTKADIAAHRRYIEELRAAVAQGIAAGRSVQELQASIKMEAYSGWLNYETWLGDNISGMYDLLTE